MKHWVGRGPLLAGLLLWASAAIAEQYTLSLFVTSTAVDAATGVVRIFNAADAAGPVQIYAIDDAGVRSGPATFTLAALAAAEFTASDLVSGNAAKGLTGGIGAQSGDVRLEIDTDLNIVPAAYTRAPDGTLGAMHDTVRAGAAAGGGYRYLVPIFSPSTDAAQASTLRLINPGDAAASVTIAGLDDNGAAAPGGTVELTLPAGAARTLTAQQLESGGTGLTGRLGTGRGRWRLTVSSDRPIRALSVVSSTAGHMNNLSTTAVAGSAPADHGAFAERYHGRGIEYRNDRAQSTFTAQSGDRFSESGQIDGVAFRFTGRYEYEAIGPDAGRLRVSYDDGDACRANLYFASRTGGWLASFCTGAEDPDGSWLGGEWSVAVEGDGGDDDDDPVATTYGVDDALPGVPTSGFFFPAVLSGGSVSSSGGGTTIRLDSGGHFELNDGTRYACASSGGCTVTNGTVTRGTVTGTSAGTGEVDRFPTFRTAAHPGNQTYTVGTAIDTLTLPEASGGNGTLTYSLSPGVPGLSFNATTRRLSGTPTAAGTYSMTYRVRDEDGDTDSLGFSIVVSDGMTETGSLGVCRVGMLVRSGQSCTYPGTADAFSVNARGRGSFLSFLAGIRIRINNSTIGGRVYDFEASHQGDGVWRIDRIAGSTEPTTGGGASDTSPSFTAGSGPGDQTYSAGTAIDPLTLPTASGGDGTLTYSLSPDVPGLTFNAATRQLTGTPSAAGMYSMTYTVTDGDGDTDTLGFTITVAGDDDHGNARGAATRVTVGSDTQGVLDAGDTDYFEIVVSGTGTLHVYTSGTTDTLGRLENADGSEIDTDDDGGSSRNFSIEESVSAGTYYVRVRGFSSGTSGTYTLHVRFSESTTGSGGGTASYGIDDALPGVATSGFFFPAVLSGGSVSSAGGGTTITLNNRGYFELNDGTRYTCTSSGGCTVRNGTVTRGTLTGGPSDDGSGSLAPADQAAFDRRFMGSSIRTASFFVDFDTAGRFTETFSQPGSYRYSSTGSNTGTLTLTYDDSQYVGGSCTVQLTFESATTGRSSFTCASGLVGPDEAWRVVGVGAPWVRTDPDSDTTLAVVFLATFEAGETRAYDFQVRTKSPRGAWTGGCSTSSSDQAGTGGVIVRLRGLQPGTVYEVRYRYRNSSACNAGTPDEWSPIDEGSTGGQPTGSGLDTFESLSDTQTVPQGDFGGIIVIGPVSGAGGGGAQMILGIGDIDVSSLDFLPEAGQIRPLSEFDRQLSGMIDR